jgi:hypothetical protein
MREVGEPFWGIAFPSKVLWVCKWRGMFAHGVSGMALILNLSKMLLSGGLSANASLLKFGELWSNMPL